jgi:hypothetical protein
MGPGRQAAPFTGLGRPARAGLSDDEARAAWRGSPLPLTPDRADAGDAARFAAARFAAARFAAARFAAAAYTVLRTNFGRAEAPADLARPAGSGSRRRAGPGRWLSAFGRARRR